MGDNLIQKIAVDVAVANPGSRTATFNFGNHDLSRFDNLTFELKISTIGVDAGDTFNGYVQSRRAAGVWDDRVAFQQVLGNASDDEARLLVLHKFGTLESAEEASEQTGSTGGSRLTAGTVKNGSFPGKYYTDGALSFAWRFQWDVVDADNDAFLTGYLYVYGDEAI